ncbi:MAG: glycosyltransferase [Syntrophales bacterium]|nr:glycosyltransferase [Syntrophales bacterium]
MYTFTPHLVSGMHPEKLQTYLTNQLYSALDRCGIKNFILWLYPPHPFVEMILDVLKEKATLIVSDCVDDHRHYAKDTFEKDQIEKRYKKVIGQSNVVFTVSKSMQKEMKKFNSEIYYIPNAIPEEVLHHNEPPPPEFSFLKRPIIGYTGALSMRIDVDLLKFIAKERPNWSIALIGTVPHPKVQELFRLENIYWFGPKLYSDIHRFINNFDVCIIPHSVNTFTDYMNPIKLYEYLASGKPIVSTDVAGVDMFRDVIEVASSSSEFLYAIEKALNQDSVKKQILRKERIYIHTWMSRAEEMMQLCLHSIQEERSKYRKKNNDSTIIEKLKNLVPPNAKKILNIGCGKGLLGDAIKKEVNCMVTGIESDIQDANKAKLILDEVITGDIEEKVNDLPSNNYDCVIFENSLEKYRNPETLLKKLIRTIKPGGQIIVYIPNVIHRLTEGQLPADYVSSLNRDYIDGGPYLYFTKNSIIKLFTNAGYEISQMSTTTPKSDPHDSQDYHLFNCYKLSTEITEGESTHPYIVVANKPQPEPKLTSIIILTYNGLHYTKQCVQSIIKSTYSPYELIIVDNGSTDGTAQYFQNIIGGNSTVCGYRLEVQEDGKVVKYENIHLKNQKKTNKNKCTTQDTIKFLSNIKIIENGKNLGFAEGNNRGIAVSNGEFIVIINNDVVVTPGWLEKMIEAIDWSENLGIAGPLTNFVSGPQMVRSVKYNTKTLEGLNEFSEQIAKTYDGHSEIFWRVVGFCMLIKREVINKIGGFDTRFRIGNFEDDDFSLRANIAGFKSVIVGDCFVHHFGSRTFKESGINYSETLLENWKVFKKKWNLNQDLSYGEEFDVQSLLNIKFDPDLHYVPLIIQEHTVSWAEKLYEKGDIEGAKHCLLKILESHPDNVEAYNDLGFIYFQEGKTEMAKDYFLRGLSINPEHPDILENLGHVMNSEGSYESAFSYFRRALTSRPNDPQLLNSIGYCLMNMGEIDKAKKFFKQSYEINEEQPHLREILESIEGKEYSLNINQVNEVR